MNEIVDWKSQMADMAKAAAALERPSLSVISLKSGIMTYQGTPIPGNKLNCIVIASAFEHRYYADRYDPNKPANPVCFAQSLSGEEMVPSADSHAKQAEACADCPQFTWGSDPQGGRGKACKAVRKLAIIPSSAFEANAGKAEMAIMTVSVTNVKHWANYVNSVSSEYARPPFGVITEIKVQPHPKTQFEVLFSAVSLLSDDYLPEAYKRIDAANKVLMTPYTYEESAPTPESKGKAKKY